ncbi:MULTISPECIES: tetratricopeptide repeat protein [Aquimarina]|uniref:Tetratricopeptide repeat protein n=1 Tax=Aquimarina algiphila TaxID=2047982 RepID=A0A554VCY3_9FLAO|nr:MULTISPECIES: tetratricopeptide repeat protein [Aquimarina]TSE04684.1 tetratricopeptide repeat protein [Aquimarina algiphila]
MKRIVEILIFLIITSGLAQDEEAFQRGNSLYNQEKYQEAIDAYKTILDTGQESASLYYNLGNAHYKLSNIGFSIFYYEKALKLKPNDDDIKNNLAFAQKATIDAIDIIPEGFISKIIKKFTNMFSFDRWAWFSVICVVLFVILFILYYTTHISSKKRLFFASSWLLLVFSLFAVFFAFKQYNFNKNNQFAIIFAQETTIKSEPNLRSEEVFELHEGTKVQVTETVNDWKKIKLADGKIGWIPATDLKEL